MLAAFWYSENLLGRDFSRTVNSDSQLSGIQYIKPPSITARYNDKDRLSGRISLAYM